MKCEKKRKILKSNLVKGLNNLVKFDELFYYSHTFFQKIVVNDVETDDDESVNEGGDDTTGDSDNEVDKLYECLK